MKGFCLMPALLFCILVFIVFLKYKLSKVETEESQQLDDYLRLERKASLPIRKSLKNLSFIELPLDELPFHPNQSTKLDKIEKQIKVLSKEKICNLSGTTNTELKLRYGAGNLDELSEYDENFAKLLRLLADWSEELYNLGFDEDAVMIATTAINYQSDVKKTFTTLARIYKKQNQIEKVYELLPIAEERSHTIDLKKAVYDVINEYE